ncbi:hypothetical protein RIEGSTA812A_PEG_456 [invertebrate metagenome]|uniref:Uncharacterized protein n=1 Tax=invertebrate metagenome TaxID=1711999 RepID=A0A484H8C6_9ZZZZ
MQPVVLPAGGDKSKTLGASVVQPHVGRAEGEEKSLLTDYCMARTTTIPYKHF